ncbi:hypothetical protein HDU99_010380 [Rhizoclosmatium hyalinum]|nr:hypothetical protein HDU99_010380 [Rhizoclosmatium hyalinum]
MSTSVSLDLTGLSAACTFGFKVYQNSELPCAKLVTATAIPDALTDTESMKCYCTNVDAESIPVYCQNDFGFLWEKQYSAILVGRKVICDAAKMEVKTHPVQPLPSGISLPPPATPPKPTSAVVTTTKSGGVAVAGASVMTVIALFLL